MDRLKGVDGFGIGNDLMGAADRQAVGQSRAGQVIVDQGRLNPDLTQADPDGDIFGPVGHEQRHAVAAYQSLIKRPMGKAIAERVKLGIGQDLAFELHGRTRTILVDDLFEIITEQIGG